MKRKEVKEDVKKEEVEVDDRIMFRKIGTGTFRTKEGKIIKPNQKFKARLIDIPLGFRDVVIPLDDLPDELVHPETSKPRFEIFAKGGGWFDVVNAVSMKPVNEKSLRKEGAEELIKGLS